MFGRTQREMVMQRPDRSAFVEKQTGAQFKEKQSEAQSGAPYYWAWKLIKNPQFLQEAFGTTNPTWTQKKELATKLSEQYSAQQLEQMLTNATQGKATGPAQGRGIVDRIKEFISPTQSASTGVDQKMNTLMEAFQVVLDAYSKGAFGDAGSGGRDAATDAFIEVLTNAKPEEVDEVFAQVKASPGAAAQIFSPSTPTQRSITDVTQTTGTRRQTVTPEDLFNLGLRR